MHHPHFLIREIKRFLRRRIKLMIIPPVLILGLSIVIVFKLEPMYRSSTTILVQRDEKLNPLLGINVSTLNSEDRLKSFNEIIYSRATISMFIDSLGMDKNISSGSERESLINEVRSNIGTHLRSSDSFYLQYYDTDPERAKRGVELLANYFIQTRLKLENNQNRMTVEFFEDRLLDLHQTVKQREKELDKLLQQNIKEAPREVTSLQENLGELQTEIRAVNRQIRDHRATLEVLQGVNQGSLGIEALNQLNLEGLPYGEALSKLVVDHTNYARKYTSEYPALKELEAKVYDLVDTILPALSMEIGRLNNQWLSLKDEQEVIIAKIEQASLVNQNNQDGMANYDLYQKLYDEMNVKLEQARTNYNLGQKAENQFVVIDPPVIPKRSSKPNRKLLVLAATFAGGILGIISGATAEVLDTTVRKPEDLKYFNKPIIAFLPEEQARNKN